jgi:hypothetical protein
MNKELKRTVKYFNKNRGLILKTIIPVVILCALVTIIGAILPRPNDNIFPSKRDYLFVNHNPNFNVAFGKQDSPDTSYVRFEAKVGDNPFEMKERNFWDNFTEFFSSKKGFEFGLSEVRLVKQIQKPVRS